MPWNINYPRHLCFPQFALRQNSLCGKKYFIFEEVSNRNEIMPCFLNKVINTRFAALLLPQVKFNTTDYTDSHRLRNKAAF
jgi:hypothetical protein